MNSRAMIGRPKSSFSWVFDIGLQGKQAKDPDNRKQYLGSTQHQADGLRVIWTLVPLTTDL